MLRQAVISHSDTDQIMIQEENVAKYQQQPVAKGKVSSSSQNQVAHFAKNTRRLVENNRISVGSSEQYVFRKINILNLRRDVVIFRTGFT